MKKIFYTFLLISPLLFVFSCEEEEEAQSGYNCVSNTCSAVFDNPQYLTLEDCQSACEEEPPVGYLCVSQNCIAVLENPSYTTLLDCQSACSHVLGCLDESACNYDENASIDDGSCEYALEWYDCEGNITAEIGDILQGGYLFYIDETGKHGLVAAIETVSSLGSWNYEWGCHSTNYIGYDCEGADGLAIGTGLQNSLDIAAGCWESEIAAKKALDYETEGYSDWYLPSRDELIELENTLGSIWSAPNSSSYWSSSDGEYGNCAYSTSFWGGITDCTPKGEAKYVLPIRSF